MMAGTRTDSDIFLRGGSPPLFFTRFAEGRWESDAAKRRDRMGQTL